MRDSEKAKYMLQLLEALKGSGLKSVKTYDCDTYRTISDGKNIIYIQVDDMPWQYSVSSVYKGSRDFGTGCRLGEMDLDTEPGEIVEKVNMFLKCSLPGWLGKNGRWPERYKDFNDYMSRSMANHGRPEVVTL